MLEKKLCSVESTTEYTYTVSPITPSIKLMGLESKYLRAIINDIFVDADVNSSTPLGEYKKTLSYSIYAKPNRNKVLLECAKWLKEVSFENFTILKIFIRYKKKEIVVVSDSMNDAILDEFYNKTFKYAYQKDNEIVFIITDEKSIDYSVMPKYDKVL